MLDLFIETLQNKFNYDEKTTRAIKKIFPSIIKYYGKEYEDIIKNSLKETRIISCNSHETINILVNKLTKININNEKSLIKENLNSTSGIYLSIPIIKYDMLLKTYVIEKTDRYIILSHTYNLDSARGLAALTHNICHLIKSYKNEYSLNNNILTKKIGISRETYIIETREEQIYMELLKDENVGLEEGFTSLDEEEILKLILNDNYETFDYDNTKKIAICLKQKLSLKKSIEEAEINSNIDTFINTYSIELFRELSYLADSSASLEDKKNNYNITKEDQIDINKELKYIIDKLTLNMTTYLKMKKN